MTNLFTFNVGKSISFDFTPEALAMLQTHTEAFHHVVMIGLKNIVQDSHASIKREDFATEAEWQAESRKVAELKLASILSGDMRKTSTTRAPKLSDRDAFARSFVVAQLKAAWIAKHGKEDWKAKTEAETGAEFIAGLVEKNAPKMADKIEAAWVAELAKREAAKEIGAGLDLDI